MKKILDKFSDCDTFSLTGKVPRYNISFSQEKNKKEKELEQFVERYNITDEEFINALNKIEKHNKEENRKKYEQNKENFAHYPEFDKLYEEIKEECYAFYSEKNREYYLNKHFNDKQIRQYKRIGLTEQKINEMKKDFFHCSFIVDNVGKTTKYGNEHKGFFWHLYHDIAMNIDRQKNKETYCVSNGKSPLEQIPSELKKHFLYYEISYFNSVTESDGLMINYYFKFNKETKQYLLKFRNDLCINVLEDLTFYKDDEVKFYSCTHEGFNSLEFNYKHMTKEEIIDFINDEFFEENNNIIIEIINKLITMEEGTKFSFKELGIFSQISMNKICQICDKLHLQLICSKNKEHNWATVTENGEFKKESDLPAILCNVEDVIEKKK